MSSQTKALRYASQFSSTRLDNSPLTLEAAVTIAPNTLSIYTPWTFFAFLSNYNHKCQRILLPKPTKTWPVKQKESIDQRSSKRALWELWRTYTHPQLRWENMLTGHILSCSLHKLSRFGKLARRTAVVHSWPEAKQRTQKTLGGESSGHQMKLERNLFACTH